VRRARAVCIRAHIKMDDCFVEVESKISIDLHPSRLRDIRGSLRQQLCLLLLTFRGELGGVVLAYRNERILTRSPLIHSIFPYFHVELTACLQVLRLAAGQRLGAKLKSRDSN
jgi:hypothetical protein